MLTGVISLYEHMTTARIATIADIMTDRYHLTVVT
jgi:hypothetical protein